jgi:DNA recombination protein RmuC
VFIPNEQVYSFINECDPAVIDAAMKNKVILCSPLTLYAILAVIRQAIDNFNLEKTATEILGLLGAFNKQWDAFKNSMERMGSRIEDASKEYTKLVTTRTRALERPLARIENLRQQKGIPEASLETLPIPSDETDNIIDIETEDE